MIRGDGVIQFVAGECLDIFGREPDSSFDAFVSWREVHPVMLHVHVARVAKAHEVVQSVRIIGLGERAHRLDVVDVGRLVGLGPASTARVEVARERCAPRSRPRRAVVPRMTALPARVVLPPTVSVAARERAEGNASHALPAVVRVVEGAAAHGARHDVENVFALRGAGRGNHGRLPIGRVRVGLLYDATREASGATGVVAGTRAELRTVLRPEVRRPALKWRSASRTRQRHSGLFGRRAKCVGARAGTRGLATPLETRSARLIPLTARWTIAFNKLWHGYTVATAPGISNAWDGCFGVFHGQH